MFSCDSTSDGRSLPTIMWMSFVEVFFFWLGHVKEKKVILGLWTTARGNEELLWILQNLGFAKFVYGNFFAAFYIPNKRTFESYLKISLLETESGVFLTELLSRLLHSFILKKTTRGEASRTNRKDTFPHNTTPKHKIFPKLQHKKTFWPYIVIVSKRYSS